jgi:ABC-2 type transport system permease protein
VSALSPHAALTRAGYRAYIRDRTTVFFTFAFPLVFLVLFGYIFRGQSVDGAGSYIGYIAPGVLAWGVGNAALFATAFTLMNWRRDDILRLIWRTPTRPAAILSARYVLALAVGLAQSVLFLGVAALPAFGLHLTRNWPLALPVLALGVAAFLALGAVVGSRANTPEAVAAIANFLMVPMAFLSGSFYPSDLMPAWLQDFSKILPLHYLNSGIESALSGRGGTAQTVSGDLGLAVFTVVFGLIAAKTFRWSNRT